MAKLLVDTKTTPSFRITPDEKISILDVIQKVTLMKKPACTQLYERYIAEHTDRKHLFIDFQFDRSEKPTPVTDWFPMLQLILELGAPRAALFREKAALCLESYLLPPNWPLADKAKKLAFFFDNMPTTFDKRFKKKVPLTIVKDLQERIGGEALVPCTYGTIHLLTLTHLIEIQPYTFWQLAIGKILTCGLCFPKHIKQIILVSARGEQNSDANKELINSTCQQFDITVSFL